MYWTRFAVREWTVTLAATEKGLCYVGLADESDERMKDWAHRLGYRELREQESGLEAYKDRIERYLTGADHHFAAIALDLKGTPFQQEVWQALCDIPYGETRTYTQMAEALGKPASVRAVASAIGKNPVLIAIPCHRIIAKNGDLSGYRDGKDRKKSLLELEKYIAAKNGIK